MDTNLAVLGTIGVLSAAAVYAMRPDNIKDTPEDCTPPRQRVPLDLNELVFDAVTVRSAGTQPSHSFHRDWKFAEVGSGGVTFEACAPNGGLVVYLADRITERRGDIQGYAVILDDQSEEHKSYISPLPGFPSPHFRSKLNKGFRVANCRDGHRRYWVVYSKGNLIVGEGDTPGNGKSRVITCLALREGDYAPPNIEYIGFGSLQNEPVGIQIRNIRVFDAPGEGCSWSAIAANPCASQMEAKGL